MNNQGTEDGAVCNRNGCDGIIKRERVNCSCHINPPCSDCVYADYTCPECDWSANEEMANSPTIKVARVPDIVHHCGGGMAIVERGGTMKLDRTKIDYYILPHSGCSQRVIGVYPEGTSSAEVRKKVDGTFGGRFKSFGNGEFEFIAYTD